MALGVAIALRMDGASGFGEVGEFALEVDGVDGGVLFEFFWGGCSLSWCWLIVVILPCAVYGDLCFLESEEWYSWEVGNPI